MTQVWQELILEMIEPAFLPVQAFFQKENVVGLWVEDDETRNPLKQDIAATGRVRLHVFFEQAGEKFKKSLIAKLVSLKPKDAGADWLTFSWQSFSNEDWVDRFKSEWTSFSLGENIWIVPSWEKETFRASDPNAILLYVDPGMAFGTGHHETTALCARAIARLMRREHAEDVRVFDVGTGTGILAILALKLGAKEAIGSDIDHDVLPIALENAANNGVAERFSAKDCAPDSMGPTFDLVVANILSEPLIQLSSQISRALKPGATLFLSGILDFQEQSVREAYLAQGLTWKATEKENEWVLIHFEKSR